MFRFISLFFIFSRNVEGQIVTSLNVFWVLEVLPCSNKSRDLYEVSGSLLIGWFYI